MPDDAMLGDIHWVAIVDHGLRVDLGPIAGDVEMMPGIAYIIIILILVGLAGLIYFLAHLYLFQVRLRPLHISRQCLDTCHEEAKKD